MSPEDERTRLVGQPAGAGFGPGLEYPGASKLVKDRPECPTQAVARGSLWKRNGCAR
jgi:hypothetical protein